jgi:phytol kinase
MTTTVRPETAERVSSVAPAAPLAFYPLTYRELRRRIWHMVPGTLAVLLQLFPHRDPISPTLRAIIVACVMAIAARILFGFRQIQRQGEGQGLAAVAGYSLSVLLTVLLFPADLEIGLAVLSILAFGDGSATMFGLMLRGRRLPWNPAKSWSGLFAFLLLGSLSTAWVYWGETHNPEAATAGVTFAMAICLTSPAVCLCAVAESLRSRLNDNIRVGLVAVCSLSCLHWLFGR